MASFLIFDEEGKEEQGVGPPFRFYTNPSEASTTETEVGGGASQDLEGTTTLGLDKAPKVGESRPSTTIEAGAKVGDT